MIHCRKCGAEVCRVSIEDVYREAMALVRTGMNPMNAVDAAIGGTVVLARRMDALEAEQQEREDNNAQADN